MRAVLLAAGEGTRLRPLTTVLPKCLVPIAGVPLLQVWLDTLNLLPLDAVLINTSYMHELVQTYLRFSQMPFQAQITFEPELLGTAGTLMANWDFISGHDVMVIHADNLSVFDPEKFVEAFESRPTGVVATIMTFDTDAPSSCGILEVETDGLTGARIVRQLHEKVENPPGNLANAAVYIFSKELLDELEPERSSLTDISTQVLPRLMGRMNTFHNKGYHRDIGQVKSYVQACDDFLVSRELKSHSSEAWQKLGLDSQLYNQWARAWEAFYPRVHACNSVEEVQSIFEESSDEQILLLERISRAGLGTLRKVAKRHPGPHFIPWRAV